jgi:hypothetical protein
LPDGDQQALVDLLEVLDVERDKLRSPEGSGEAEQEDN